MADIEKISKEVANELSTKLNELPPFPGEMVTANSIKKAIIDISTEICCKILERYEKQK